jgi:hypothetical protein
MVLFYEDAREANAEFGCYVSTMSLASGLVFGEAAKVSTDSFISARSALEAVRAAYYLMTGVWCTEPQALAAVYSVPEGAPLTMAVDNVSPDALPSVEAAMHYEKMRASMQAFARRAPRG